MTTYTFTITENYGEFFVNGEEEGFRSREDAIFAIEEHCEAEGLEYVIAAAPAAPIGYNVFAHGTFWGKWVAETAEAAIQMAAHEVGTDGNTDGLTAEIA